MMRRDDEIEQELTMETTKSRNTAVKLGAAEGGTWMVFENEDGWFKFLNGRTVRLSRLETLRAVASRLYREHMALPLATLRQLLCG